MAMDPLYMSAVREESLTKRNFITNFYRIKEEGLRPLWGPDTDDYVTSETIPGGEKVYFFRANVSVHHQKIHREYAV